ncbi:MAG: S-layer homology domain-containing protein [Gemmatimonadales bacterium]
MGRFTDVPDGSPFADEIERVAAAGIMMGYDDGTFRPGEAVTNERFAAAFSRAIGGMAGAGPAGAGLFDFTVIFQLLMAWGSFLTAAGSLEVGQKIESPPPYIRASTGGKGFDVGLWARRVS